MKRDTMRDIERGCAERFVGNTCFHLRSNRLIPTYTTEFSEKVDI
jgi:hypothetical protein